MGTIDWSHPRADLYISQMRELEKAGDPLGTIRRRPASNAAERTMAREIRRRVDRFTFGYRAGSSGDAAAPATRPGRKVCEVCGRRRGLRLARQVWKGAAPINIWRCKGGC